MFVVHVLSSFGLGGQEQVALELARREALRGHRVVGVAFAPGPLEERFARAGVVTHVLPKRARLDPTLPLRIARVAHGADVVHTHNPQALVYGAPAASLAQAALVHSKHGRNPDAGRRRWLRRHAGRRADAFVAVTPALADLARRHGEGVASRIFVVENGIDVSPFGRDPEARNSVRRELGIPSRAWVVGSVGRLSPEKNQRLLLDAMRELDATLVLVGDGPLRPDLERAAGSRVVLTGRRDDVARVLAAFDVFALSSDSEGLPLVLLEALASELPVIATQVGGVSDLIHDGRTGLLVPAGDVVRFATGLAALQQDPPKARAMAKAGRALVHERHDAERMTQRYLALCSECVLSRRLARAGALSGALSR